MKTIVFENKEIIDWNKLKPMESEKVDLLKNGIDLNFWSTKKSCSNQFFPSPGRRGFIEKSN